MTGEPGWRQGGADDPAQLIEERGARQAAVDRLAEIAAALARTTGRTGGAMQVADVGAQGPAVRAALRLVRVVPPLRFCAHVATPNTTLLAIKPAF